MSRCKVSVPGSPGWVTPASNVPLAFPFAECTWCIGVGVSAAWYGGSIGGEAGTCATIRVRHTLLQTNHKDAHRMEEEVVPLEVELLQTGAVPCDMKRCIGRYEKNIGTYLCSSHAPHDARTQCKHEDDGEHDDRNYDVAGQAGRRRTGGAIGLTRMPAMGVKANICGCVNGPDPGSVVRS